MKSHYHFFENLTKLRLTAAVIYDRGLAMGAAKEQIGKDIEPLKRELEDLIGRTVKHDVAGIIYAVKSMENELAGLKADAEFVLKKQENLLLHIGKVKDRLVAEMVAKGTETVVDGEFSAVLIDGRLNLR